LPDVSPASPPRPLGRSLVISVAVTTALFVITLAVIEWSGFGIQSRAHTIASHAGPSVEHLAGMRRDLRHYEVLADDYADRVLLGDVSRAGPDEKAIDAVWSSLKGEWSLYQTLPSLRGERQLWPGVAGLLSDLAGASARMIDAVHRRDGTAAETTLNQEVKPLCDRLDAAVERVERFDADRAAGLAQGIQRLWGRSLLLAVVLGVFSTVSAVFAALVAVRVIRQSARLLLRRAEELDAFAGRVAHDIRNPLGTLQLTLDVISRQLRHADGSAPSVTDAIERGNRSLARANQIVEGLLGFARAGAQSEPGARCDAVAVLGGVVEELAPAARQHQIDLRLEAAGPCVIACSAGVLTSIASNLVANAIEHMGDARERQVGVRLSHGSSRTVVVEVEDTGPGIPDDVDRLFEPFVRGPKDGASGIGLGLATVRRLAEAHGGGAGARRRAERGSVFWVELPNA
jgi:signal transduction histidine kinase